MPIKNFLKYFIPNQPPKKFDTEYFEIPVIIKERFKSLFPLKFWRNKNKT